MNEDNKINQIRREVIELYNRRQQLIEQSKQEQMIEEIPSNNVSANQNMASKSNTVEKGKTLTLSNGHSILGDNNKFNGGFTNMLIMALLAGFASGAIATAVYIFMNLGKVTINL